MAERTLALVKPNDEGIFWAVWEMVQKAGLKPTAEKAFNMNRRQAEAFYEEHRGKDHYFPRLIDYMTSGTTHAWVFEGEGVILKWRALMGATDPSKRADWTIRKKLGHPTDWLLNIVHGSDSPEAAAREIGLVFSGFDFLR